MTEHEETTPDQRHSVPVYDARALVADGVKAEIRLDGQIYTLRITRGGKLILTK
ncbi:hemin uptake protein HemP [Sagittula salina]|uniref:Hemin uptake protein HemP n=1 Tax=Sagittula salina TaxID=2820268 RepID=A0A940MQC8_9RHOB|nr:hemin uptake protein HemP [Sagittula salina]MBP0482798.1 hemin uptake protein HemP [Sagittula salina]